MTTFSALLDIAKEPLRAPVGYHSLVADEVPEEISGHLKMNESLLLAIIDGGFHLIGPFNKNLPKNNRKSTQVLIFNK